MIDSRGSAISQSAAFYVWPAVLINNSDPAAENIPLEEEVFRKTLRYGIAVKILREGIVVFDFSDWPAEKGKRHINPGDFDETVERVVRRVSVMNAYLTCFYTAVYRLQQTRMPVMRVHSSSLLQFASLDDPTLQTTVTGCPDAFIRAVRTDSNWRRAPRSVEVQAKTIKSSFQQFDLVLDERRTDMIAFADLYLRSCLACAEHEYSLALITAWTIIEKVLNFLWFEYLDENRERERDTESLPFISKDRRDRLTNGRDFTASVVSEILSLNSRISFSLYRSLSEVRKARNNWMHDLKPASRKMARSAIEAAGEMMALAFKLEFQIPFVSGISV